MQILYRTNSAVSRQNLAWRQAAAPKWHPGGSWLALASRFWYAHREVRVEYAPVLENEVVLRCPRLDQEMLRVLSLVRSGLQKLCVWDENREIILLSPDETLYCESVDEHTFLYTASAFYQTALTLAELEGRYGELGDEEQEGRQDGLRHPG